MANIKWPEGVNTYSVYVCSGVVSLIESSVYLLLGVSIFSGLTLDYDFSLNDEIRFHNTKWSKYFEKLEMYKLVKVLPKNNNYVIQIFKLFNWKAIFLKILAYFKARKIFKFIN